MKALMALTPRQPLKVSQSSAVVRWSEGALTCGDGPGRFPEAHLREAQERVRERWCAVCSTSNAAPA